jgi:5-methylcytosine-specific restriction enzyme B
MTVALSSEPGANALYSVHARWLTGVLGAGGSLFTPGAAIWTADHLDELESGFSGRPDLTKGKRFLEKLHDQLADVSPQAVQLMAELHAVHFLIIWTGAISAAKKRSDIEAILSWMPVPCTVPENVLAAMEPGLVHPGQWVMTRRDTQLTWLIRFSRAWKELPGERQQLLIGDPWAMKVFAESIHAASSDGARLALLHLAHPETFEEIVSPAHRQLIVDRFADMAGSDQDIDRRLLAARAALSAGYGKGFDWYADPLVHRWWKNSKAWPQFLGWLEAFGADADLVRQERQVVLQIAQHAREARTMLVADEADWPGPLRQALATLPRQPGTAPSGEDLDSAEQAFRVLWDGEQPSPTRLQAFADTVPAAIASSPEDAFDLGTCLLAAEDPATFPPIRQGVILKAWELCGWGPGHGMLPVSKVYDRALVFLDELMWESSRWKMPLQSRLDACVALQALVTCLVKPGTWADERWAVFAEYRGLTPAAASGSEQDPGSEQETGDDREPVPLVDHIAAAAGALHIDRAVLDEIVELLEDKGQVVLYGPPGTGKTYLAVRLARAIAAGDASRMSLVQFHPATTYEDFFEGLRPRVTDAGHVTYERTSGPLMAIAQKAVKDPAHTYILVIDEINRANLPKVFGELLFLLQDRTQPACTLYRPEEPFLLPANVWFIATMNTADRSVAVIDAAMRRRFHFVPFFPHEGPMKGLLRRWLTDGGGRAGVADLLEGVNGELFGLLGEHLLIGPSHFMKADLSDRALARIWTYNVFPLIEEQLWGNREQIARWRWESVRQRYSAALAGSAASSPATGAGNGSDDEPGHT